MLWLAQYWYLPDRALSQKRRWFLQLQTEQLCQSAELSLSTYAAANQLETTVSKISWVDLKFSVLPVFSKLNCSLKSDRHKYTHMAAFTSRFFTWSLGLRPYLCLTLEKTLSMCGTQSVDLWRLCGRILSSPTVSEFPKATSFPVRIESSWKFRCLLLSRWVSFCHPWELDTASRLNYPASGFPVLDHSFCQGALIIQSKNLSRQWRPGSSSALTLPRSVLLLPVLASFSPSF